MKNSILIFLFSIFFIFGCSNKNEIKKIELIKKIDSKEKEASNRMELTNFYEIEGFFEDDLDYALDVFKKVCAHDLKQYLQVPDV